MVRDLPVGFEPGDTSDTGADFLLVDWKQATQSFSFTGGTADNTPGTTATGGLAASRISGVPTADEFWGHSSFGEAGDEGGANLGQTGWEDFVEYSFRFVFTANQFQVYVDDVLQISLNGSFPEGRLGFYAPGFLRRAHAGRDGPVFLARPGVAPGVDREQLELRPPSSIAAVRASRPLAARHSRSPRPWCL